MTKKLISLFLACCLMFSFASCNKKSTDGETSGYENESLIAGLLNSDTTDSDNQTKPDKIKMGGAYPEYIRSWNDDEDFNTFYYSYAGDELVMKHYLANGSFSANFGLCVMLDGVLQNFYIVDDKTGEKSEQTTVLSFDMTENEEKDFTIHFIPNIGKKGDVLEVSVGIFFFYDYVLEKGASFLNYGNYHGYSDTNCRKVVMQVDSENTAAVLPYDAEYLEVDNRLSEYYYDLFDESGGCVQLIYTNSFDSMFTEEGMKHYVTASENSMNTYSLDLFAATGTYRISVFVDHVQQELADGCYYYDVQTQTDKDTHIEVTLDNTNMTGWHHIYFMARSIGGDFDNGKSTAKCPTYPLILE